MTTTEKPIGDMTLIDIQDFMSTPTPTQTDTPETNQYDKELRQTYFPHAFGPTYKRALDHARTLERARDAALRELAKWNPIIQEIHRRADKEHAEADNVDFAVTVSIGDYRQAINSAKEAQ